MKLLLQAAGRIDLCGRRGQCTAVTQRRHRIRLTGTLRLTAAAFAVIGSGTALGEDLPGAVPAGAAEQITVTGQGPWHSPVATTVLDADAIARSGASSIGALLDQLPSFGSQGVNSAQNDGGFGEYFIDLRNLNFDRTLVLVDGKRFVLSGIQTDEAVDLNNIPLAFIDHVEVLRDGTQPQYAGDAVAGVVNVVLKDQVDGLHMDLYGGAAGAGDGGTTDLSLLSGRQFGATHVAVGLNYYHRDPVLQADRGWSADPIASAITAQTVFGSQAALGGHAIGDGVDALALGGGRARPYDAATDSYDPAGSRYLQGELQRETAYVDADTRLSDEITADVELLYTDRQATTLQPPQMLGLTGTDKHPDGFVVPAGAPGDPFAVPVTLERVVGEAGGQLTTTSGPVWRVLGGLQGTLDWDRLDGGLGGWAWTASFDHGQSLSRYVADNQIDLTRALQTVGALPCPAAQGCVAADWFGPDSLSTRALDYIRYTGVSQSSYGETVGQASLSGPVVALPGGPARVTVGAELRREEGATSVDSVTARGDQAGSDARPTAGGYSTAEAYTTLDLPLLRDLPAARRLDVQLAARETATSRYGAFTTLRAVMDYQPVAGIRLHAVSGTARRPPAISEAFGGITANLQPVSDPCDQAGGLRGNAVVDANCRSQGLGPGFTQSSPLVAVESGGNRNLHPEQSENEMLGLTLSPPGWPGLSASVDWYHYRIRNAIDSLADTDPNLIPDACYESAHLSSPLCGLVTRIGGGGNAGQISDILGLDENVGTIKTDGLEFGASASPPAGAWGQLHLDCQVNWLLDYRLHTEGTPGFVQYAGTFPGLAAVGSYARLRLRTVAGWEDGPWGLSWTGPVHLRRAGAWRGGRRAGYAGAGRRVSGHRGLAPVRPRFGACGDRQCGRCTAAAADRWGDEYGHVDV